MTYANFFIYRWIFNFGKYRLSFDFEYKTNNLNFKHLSKVFRWYEKLIEGEVFLVNPENIWKSSFGWLILSKFKNENENIELLLLFACLSYMCNKRYIPCRTARNISYNVQYSWHVLYLKFVRHFCKSSSKYIHHQFCSFYMEIHHPQC